MIYLDLIDYFLLSKKCVMTWNTPYVQEDWEYLADENI